MPPRASRCASLNARIATGWSLTPCHETSGGRSVHGSLGCTMRPEDPNTRTSTIAANAAASPPTTIRPFVELLTAEPQPYVVPDPRDHARSRVRSGSAQVPGQSEVVVGGAPVAEPARDDPAVSLDGDTIGGV